MSQSRRLRRRLASGNNRAKVKRTLRGRKPWRGGGGRRSDRDEDDDGWDELLWGDHAA